MGFTAINKPITVASTIWSDLLPVAGIHPTSSTPEEIFTENERSSTITLEEDTTSDTKATAGSGLKHCAVSESHKNWYREKVIEYATKAVNKSVEADRRAADHALRAKAPKRRQVQYIRHLVVSQLMCKMSRWQRSRKRTPPTKPVRLVLYFRGRDYSVREACSDHVNIDEDGGA